MGGGMGRLAEATSAPEENSETKESRLRVLRHLNINAFCHKNCDGMQLLAVCYGVTTMLVGAFFV